LAARVCQVAAHRCGALVIQSMVRVGRSGTALAVCGGVGRNGSGRGMGWTRCWVLKERALRPLLGACAVRPGCRVGLGCFFWITGPVPPPRVWGGGWWARLLFENCTVDASISETRDPHEGSRFPGFLVWVFCFSVAICLIVSCVQVFKGIRWMPWHQEPMKDVGACDMPRGVGNQTLIRGCPNGETWHSLWGVAAG
jgi:hypothetical protein